MNHATRKKGIPSATTSAKVVLGVYVTLFFIVAQLNNLVFFQVRPDLPLLFGGAMIAGGGLVITFLKP